MTPTISMPLTRSADEEAIRDSVRAICSDFRPDYIRKLHDAHLPDKELWGRFAEAGFCGTNLPEEWGGSNLGIAGMAVVVEEAAACGQYPLMLILSSAMAGTFIARHGTQAQKQRWLPGLASGQIRMAFSITEPGAGTNAHRMSTSLRKEGDHYVLKGQKVFTSGVEVARHLVVVARFRHEDGSMGKPTLAVIDTDAPGLTRTLIEAPAMAAELHWQMFFDDVKVPAENILGGVEAGLKVVFDGLNAERVLVAAVCNGFARYALEKACNYARERVVWDEPIGAHQSIAHPLARGKVQLELARLMTQKAALLLDASQPSAGEASNMAKFAAAEAATLLVDRAVQTHGGNGLTYEYGIVDMWWRVRGLKIGPVSEEMVLNHIAQHSLGLPRSY